MPLIDINRRDRLPHPFEPGEWIEIRPLLAIQMDEAQEKQIKRLMETWGDQLANFPKNPGAGRPEEQPISVRAQAYDRETLLAYAVAGWSYSEPINPGAILRLDPATQVWLAEEIVARNTRPLVRGSNTA